MKLLFALLCAALLSLSCCADAAPIGSDLLYDNDALLLVALIFIVILVVAVLLIRRAIRKKKK